MPVMEMKTKNIFLNINHNITPDHCVSVSQPILLMFMALRPSNEEMCSE